MRVLPTAVIAKRRRKLTFSRCCSVRMWMELFYCRIVTDWIGLAHWEMRRFVKMDEGRRVAHKRYTLQALEMERKWVIFAAIAYAIAKSDTITVALTSNLIFFFPNIFWFVHRLDETPEWCLETFHCNAIRSCSLTLAGAVMQYRCLPLPPKTTENANEGWRNNFPSSSQQNYLLFEKG